MEEEGKKIKKKWEMEKMDEREKRRKLRQWKCKNTFSLIHKHTDTHVRAHTHTQSWLG